MNFSTYELELIRRVLETYHSDYIFEGYEDKLTEVFELARKIRAYINSEAKK